MKKHNIIFNKWFIVFYLLTINLCLTSCNKSETLITAALSDYYPLQTGKYITYQLDSLVYLSFGTRDTTISYQVKYVTDTEIIDNLGRPAYRIYRYIRKNETNSWTPEGTCMAVIADNGFEYTENNLRFIKLKEPFKDYFSWKGNSFIDTYSANSMFRYLDNWDYTYTNSGLPDIVGNYSLENTVTVNQRDEIIGDPNDPSGYSEINFGQEKYAKGIGMVYRKLFHSEFQPGNGGYFADGSYGVTYTMIDHN